MTIKNLMFPLGVSLLLFGACTKEDVEPKYPVVEKEPTEENERNLGVENFIYKGMNFWYLYKSNVPDLADTRFATQEELDEFLLKYENPSDLFYNGLMDKTSDRFSFLVEDYIELEKNFSGTSTTTGVNYGLSYLNNTSDIIIGYVRYVAPGSPSEGAGVKRGDIFTKIDGIQLNDSNYGQLLSPSSFTLTLAEIRNGQITETGETATLQKAEFTENPILIAKTIEVDGRRIGYLMYNSFVDVFDDELNAAFADFKAANITDLVLDLRYNGGGYVESAVDLASMITGQFEGETFLKKQFNPAIQASLEQDDPEYLIDRFNGKIRTGEAINSLNLNEVYIIATGSSASASELMLNSLEPYITVNHVGTTTVGKFQASTTFYDTPNFTRPTTPKNHAYAIQPLIYKSSNANGKSDFVKGLDPDIKVIEYIDEFETLGEPTEPLLAAAIAAITGQKRAVYNDRPAPKLITESGQDLLNYQRMYTEDLPVITE